MIDPIRELKIRAEILQRQLNHRRPAALERLRSLPEFRSRSYAGLEAAGPGIRRRQCLSLIAAEFGFSGWQHATAVISGAHDVRDFGTLLCPRRCGAHLSLWYRLHSEAVVGRRASGGYLLAYRRDLLVVDRWFIGTLGLDPDDPAWRQLGFDWVRPRDMRARTCLYGMLIERTPRETGS